VFNPEYATDSFGLIGPEGAMVEMTAGAMAQNTFDGSTQVQTGGYYKTGSAVNYLGRGGDWGGIFFHLANPVDLLTLGATKINIAVKGDMPGMTYWDFKPQTGSGGATAVEVNILSLATVTTDGEWTIYSINLDDAALATVDFSEFFGMGLYHPRTLESGSETDVNAAVIACDVLVSVAFF